MKVDAPEVAAMGTMFTIKLSIQSRLASLERLKMVINLNDNYLITGNSSSVIDVSNCLSVIR